MENIMIQVCQDKISRAYQEQIWAVVLNATLNGFIFTHIEKLKSICFLVVIGISLITILSFSFIIIKHLTYIHYDKIISDFLESSEKVKGPSLLFLFGKKIALYMGVSVYTFITIGSSAVTIYFLYNFKCC